jgi:hypothetical protein
LILYSFHGAAFQIARQDVDLETFLGDLPSIAGDSEGKCSGETEGGLYARFVDFEVVI